MTEFTEAAEAIRREEGKPNRSEPSDALRAEAERDDERMRDPAEVAAAREFNRECREDR